MRTTHLPSRSSTRAADPARPTLKRIAALLYGIGAASLAAPAALAQAQAESGQGAVPIVTVTGEAPGAITAYAGGQVASGGRVGFLGDKDFMETPFSTVAYTSTYIQDLQAKDLTDVIAKTDPTVFSNGVSGAWSENYSIRGFAASTSDLTVNGLAGMAPYYRTSPEMFERIEVQKGPSALLNGMPPGGSVGGAINLVPKRAGDAPLTRLTGTFLADAQFGAHVDLGRRFGERKQFGIRFNGVYRDGDGPVDRQERKADLAALGLDWRGDGVRLSADLYHSDDRVDGVTRGLGLAAGVGVPRPPKADTLLNPSWAHATTCDKGAMARAEIDLGANMMAYAAAGASRSNYEYNGAISSALLNEAGDFRTTMAQLRMDIRKTSAEAGLRGTLRTGGVRHQWALNVTHYEDKQHDHGRRSVPGADWVTNIYNPVWGPVAPMVWPPTLHSETRLSSVGIADTLSFAGDRVQLTAGLRRQEVRTDSFNVNTGARASRYDASATSPAAALLVRLERHLSLYANYIEGLSKGQSAPASAANAGELFPPYKSRQKEAGLKLDSGMFTHTLSVFEIERPASYTDPATNIFSFGGEQRNRGAEWGFFGTPLRGTRLMGGVAWVDPEVTRSALASSVGKQATGVPKLQGKFGVEWDVPGLQGLTLTGNATSVSKQYISADNALWAAGRTTFDVGARYGAVVAGRQVTLRGNVTNLTDKAYWGMPLLSSLALGAPRTVQLSVSVDM